MKRLFAIVTMFAIVALTGCKKDEVDDSDGLDFDTNIGIVFEDSNFEQALIDSGVDTDKDGCISEEEALAVYEIDVRNKGIKSLVGLDYFVNLQVLKCSGNADLTEIAQFTNTALIEIECNDTQVEDLDVCLCPNLEIYCANTVSSTFVKDSAQEGNLLDLGEDLTVDTDHVFFIGSDEYKFSDDNLRLALLNENNTIDQADSEGKTDGVISWYEVRTAKAIDISADVMATVTKSLILDATRATTAATTGAGFVRNMTSIADFVALESLNADNNVGLSYINLSDNPKLQSALINSVSIAVLSDDQYADGTFKGAVESGASGETQIVSVSHEVQISNKDIKEALVKSYAGDTGVLTYGDAAKADKLELNKVSVMNIEAGILCLPSLSTLSLTECTSITTLDTSSAGELADLNVSGITTLESVDLTASTKLTALNVSATAITEMVTEVLTELESLNISETSISELDLSENTSLSTLVITDSKLTKLDVSSCADAITIEGNDAAESKLEEVVLSETQANDDTIITALSDIVAQDGGVIYSSADDSDSATRVFPGDDDEVYFADANLEKAIVAAYNTANSSATITDHITYGQAESMTSLEIVDTDDDNRFINIKPLKNFINLKTLSLKTYSQVANELDLTKLEKLETLTLLFFHANSELRELDFSFSLVKPETGSTPVAALRSLTLGSKTLSSLVGTEFITGLTYLNLYGLEDIATLCKLTSDHITISDLTKLVTLDLSYTTFSDLDFSGLTALQNLSLSGTSLSTVDLTSCTKLAALDVSNMSNLTTIDLSKNTELASINVAGSNVTILDLTNCSSTISPDNVKASAEATEATDAVASKLLTIKLTSAQYTDNKTTQGKWDALLTSGDNFGIYVGGADTDKIDFECENFKDYLVSIAGVDTSGDGDITYAEAKAFVGSISLNSDNSTIAATITSLAEVKYFPNMTSINLAYATNASLNDIDLTYNMSITSALVNRPNLTGTVKLPGGGIQECTTLLSLYIQTTPVFVDLDLTKFPNLTTLFCGDEEMKSLKIPASVTKLTIQGGTHADFETVDLSANTSMTYFAVTTATNYMKTLDISKTQIAADATAMVISYAMPSFEKLIVSDDQWGEGGANASVWSTIFSSTYATNPFFAIYDTNGTQLSTDPEITLSDSVFHAYAIANDDIDADKNDVLTRDEAMDFTGTLVIPNGVKSLADMQYFTSATGINLDACTSMISINLSAYTTLKSISTQNDKITTLVIPTSTTSLALGGGLTTLDLSGATDLAASAVSATSASITALTLNQTQAAAGEDGTTTDTLETLADAIMAAGSEISVIQDSGSTYIYTYDIDTVVFKGEKPADAIEFADTNFETYLLAVGNENGTGSVVAPAEGAINNDPADYYIGTGEAAAYTGKLVIPSTVTSLSDLSYFTAITAIDLSDYTGTSANLTANTKLTTVTATGANLVTLTLPASVATLDIEGSKVAVLDISATTMTVSDLTAGAQLTTLKLPSGSDASEWTSFLVASGASTITVDGEVTVYMDGAEDTGAPYTFINSTFETYIKTLSDIDADNNGTISVAEVATYAGELVLTSTVTGVTGDIENFACITKFDAVLATTIADVTLDLSNAPDVTYIALADWNTTVTTLLLPDTDKLETLDVEYGRITSLNLKDRKALTTLSCGSHYLAELDVTGCTNLQTLNLRATATTLTELDLTDLTSLTAFGSGNWSNLSVKIAELDFSNTQLTVANFVTVGNTANGTSLSYLEVLKLNTTQQDEGIANWGAKIASTAMIHVDNGASVSVFDVNGNAQTSMPSGTITTLPTAFETYLLGIDDLNNDGGKDDYITEYEAKNYTGALTIPSTVTDITGIEYFTAITEINLADYTGTSVDLSDNAGLTTITATNSKLATLTLPTATGTLETLDISGSAITEISVSAYSALSSLDISSTSITTLDVSSNESITAADLTAGQLEKLYLNSTQAENLSGAEAWTGAMADGGRIYVGETSYTWSGTELTQDVEGMIDFADTAFGAYVAAIDAIDTEDDDVITKTEAAAYAGALPAIPNGVTDLSDLVYFEKVTEIGFATDFASITSLNLSAYTSAPALASISVKDCTSVTSITVPSTTTTLDISGSSIKVLDISGTSMTSSDLTAGSLTSLTLPTGATAADWTTALTATGSASITVGTTTTLYYDGDEEDDDDEYTFINSAFETYVKGLGTAIDVNGNGKISPAEVATYSGSIAPAATDAVTTYADDLKNFVSITTLDVSKCSAVVDLDLSPNVKLATITLLGTWDNVARTVIFPDKDGDEYALTTLSATNSGFTALDLTGRSKLTTLTCGGPNLVTFSVVGCTELTSISFTGGTSTSVGDIDLSTNTKLASFSVTNGAGVSYYTCFNTLDFSKTAMTVAKFTTEVTATGTYSGVKFKNLEILVLNETQAAEGISTWGAKVLEDTLIQVVDSQGNVTGTYDINGDPAVVAPATAIEFDDTAFETYIKSVMETEAEDGYITEEEAEGYTGALVINASVASLSDLQYFTGVTELDLTACAMTTVDLSSYTWIATVDITGSKIIALDLSSTDVTSDSFKASADSLTSLTLPSDATYDDSVWTAALAEGATLVTDDASYTWDNEEGTLEMIVEGAIDFADNALKAYLLTVGGIDGNSAGDDDDVITTYEAAAFTGTLTIPDTVTSLDDLEYFTAMTQIDLSSCKVADIDLSANDALTTVTATSSYISSLTLPETTTLKTLNVEGSHITVLDLSSTGVTTSFDATDDSLTSLILPSGTDHTATTWTDALADEAKVTVGDVVYTWDNDAEAYEDTTAVAGAIEFQSTSFRNYLLAVDSTEGTTLSTAIDSDGDEVAEDGESDENANATGMIDANDDGTITEAEAAAYTGKIQLKANVTVDNVTTYYWANAATIETLEDLKYFTNISHLVISNCSNAALTTLDLSKHMSLTAAQINRANLTSVTLPGGTSGSDKLASLYIQTVPFTAIDLTMYSALTTLYVGSPSMSSLEIPSSVTKLYLTGATDTSSSSTSFTGVDLSANTSLALLSITLTNYMTSLDISNTGLDTSKVTISATLPNLTKLVMSESQWGEEGANATAWAGIFSSTYATNDGFQIYTTDGTTETLVYTNGTVAGTSYAFTDTQFKAALEAVADGDGIVTAAELAAMTSISIDCGDYAISDDTFNADLAACTSLESLTLTNSTITELNISTTKITSVDGLNGLTGLTSLTLPSGETAADWASCMVAATGSSITVDGAKYEYTVNEDADATWEVYEENPALDGCVVVTDANIDLLTWMKSSTSYSSKFSGDGINSMTTTTADGITSISTSDTALVGDLYFGDFANLGSVSITNCTGITSMDFSANSSLLTLTITNCSGLVSEVITIEGVANNNYKAVLILPEENNITTASLQGTGIAEYDFSTFEDLTTLTIGGTSGFASIGNLVTSCSDTLTSLTLAGWGNVVGELNFYDLTNLSTKFSIANWYNTTSLWLPNAAPETLSFTYATSGTAMSKITELVLPYSQVESGLYDTVAKITAYVNLCMDRDAVCSVYVSEDGVNKTQILTYTNPAGVATAPDGDITSTPAELYEAAKDGSTGSGDDTTDDTTGGTTGDTTDDDTSDVITFADETFEEYLLTVTDLSGGTSGTTKLIDVDGDGEITENEAAGYAGTIVVPADVESIDGIEYLTGITAFDGTAASFKEGTTTTATQSTFDFSKNVKLTSMKFYSWFQYNTTTSPTIILPGVDPVDGEYRLVTFSAPYSGFTSLDFTGYTNLESVSCGGGGGKLATFSVEGCESLVTLNLNGGLNAAVTSLDLDACEALTTISFSCSSNYNYFAYFTELDLTNTNVAATTFSGKASNDTTVDKLPSLTTLTINSTQAADTDDTDTIQLWGAQIPTTASIVVEGGSTYTYSGTAWTTGN